MIRDWGRSAEFKELVFMALVAPFVVVFVTGVLYYSFKAWVWMIVFCLHRAQAWGWWP